MTEQKRPEAFPEHLRPYLLPMPETPDEAFELLIQWALVMEERRGSSWNDSEPLEEAACASRRH